MISGRNKLVQSNVHFAVGRKDIGQSAVNVNIDAVHFADRQNHTGTLRHRIGVTRLQNLADIEFAVVFDLNPGFFFYIDNDTAFGRFGRLGNNLRSRGRFCFGLYRAGKRLIGHYDLRRCRCRFCLRSGIYNRNRFGRRIGAVRPTLRPGWNSPPPRAAAD